MKFFSRRQMRSIHKSMQERERRKRNLGEEAVTGRRPVVQILSGNLDRLVIVASLSHPTLRPGLIDRLLVLSEQENLRAIVVLSKRDLLPEAPGLAERYQQLYSSLGYPTLLTSIEWGRGIEELRSHLKLGRSALCGHSGVGKSSLLKALDPNLSTEVGEVSLATDKGQHTTTAVRLYRMEGGGEIFDLPGLKLAPLHLPAEELGRCFPDFVGCQCRFRDCLHQSEPRCGVREAVEQGLVDEERYRSYLRILQSISSG